MTSPTRAWAWFVSAGVHAVLLGLALAVLARTPRPVPVREAVIYVEPVPPPPPPLGAPLPATDTPPVPVAEAGLLPARPERTPERVATPAHRPRPSPPAAPAARGVANGTPDGPADGVAGGEIGGQTGGTVGGHGDVPVPAEQVEHPPVVVSRVVPAYPSLARAQGLEGLVVLRVIIDRGGGVEPAIVVTRSLAGLDEAAVAALRRWRFDPGRDHDGQPVRVVLEVPMRFQLR